MLYETGDRVRVVAWAIPGVFALDSQKVVCGEKGVVLKVREGGDQDNTDGNYHVRLESKGTWWFRSCDLVPEDSPCTCDNTIRHEPLGACPVHENYHDPAQAAAEALTKMVKEMEAQTDCHRCDGAGMYLGGPPDYPDLECSSCDGKGWT